MEKYIYRGKLDRVIDGDTVDALIDVGQENIAGSNIEAEL